MEYTPYLIHYGVKGMKWGVRRTDAQLARARGQSTASNSKSSVADKEKRRATAKKVAAATAAVVTVAAAATVYAKNPKVRSAVSSVVSKAKNISVADIKAAGKKSVETGKAYTKKALKKAKETGKDYGKKALDSAKKGVAEAIETAPKEAAKAVVSGIIMNAAKRILDDAVGREESARIFQANNKKKISSFWKVSSEDKDEDD